MGDLNKRVIQSKLRLKDNIPMFQQLVDQGRNCKKRKKVLDGVKRDTINCICECVKNIASGNIPVSSEEIGKLKKHKRRIEQLVDSRTGIKQKGKLLNQSGGFLPLILAPILGVAGSLIGEAISGAIKK